MAKKPINVKQYRKAVAAGQLTDPLIFLEGLVRGQDLRRPAQIYTLVMEIDESGELDPEDWREVVRLVKKYYKYEAVTVNESQRAAMTLAEYLHPKVKSDDKGDGQQGPAPLEPLTEEEIILLKDKWNESY